MTLIAHMYPDPTDPGIPHGDVFEIVSGDDVLINDVEVRDHPEVPLSTEQRDTVLNRLGYTRVGPWTDDKDRAYAPVTPANEHPVHTESD